MGVLFDVLVILLIVYLCLRYIIKRQESLENDRPRARYNGLAIAGILLSITNVFLAFLLPLVTLSGIHNMGGTSYFSLYLVLTSEGEANAVALLGFTGLIGTVGYSFLKSKYEKPYLLTASCVTMISVAASLVLFDASPITANHFAKEFFVKAITDGGAVFLFLLFAQIIIAYLLKQEYSRKKN